MNNGSLTARKPNHPGGRPSIFRSGFCDRIAAAMAEGLSAEAAAAKIGISARSLFNWQREHPEFLQAIMEGRQRSLLWWEERALDLAKGKPGNTAIVSLGLRNRSRSPSGWHDNHRLEDPVGQAPQYDLSKLTVEELETLERLVHVMSVDEGEGGDRRGIDHRAGEQLFDSEAQPTRFIRTIVDPG